MTTYKNGLLLSLVALGLILGFSLGAVSCDAGPAARPQCSDDVKNGDETDIDCGGPSCQVCSIGKGCLSNTDCLNDSCLSGRCSDPNEYPSCSDKVKNGGESDIDCGGLCPTRCPLGAECILGTDCASTACVNDICQNPTCTDGYKNGSETDVDCGGSCGPCGVGQACLVAGDCSPALCSNKRCGLGDGRDGIQRVTAGMTLTINQTASAATGVKGGTTLTVQNATGMAKGQTLFVHQTQGTGAGQSELNLITDLSGTTLTLQTPLANNYATGAQAIVVPQYTSVTVSTGATLTAPAWDGSKGGVLIFQCNGNVTIDGTLSMRGRGFRGAGTANVCFPGAPGCLLNHGRYGESESGPLNFSTMNVNGKGGNNGGGGGGGTRGQDCAAGGGGSYGTSGAPGADGTLGTCIMGGLHGGGLQGAVLGTADLTQSIFLGPAGGEGGPDESGAYPGIGGSGGGIIALYVGNLTVNAGSGAIDASGSDGGSGSATGPCGGSGAGMGNGGGGAGGGIRILSGGSVALASSRVVALGGSGGAVGGCSGYPGGGGGMGRIQVRTSGNVTGVTIPAAYPM